MIRQTLAAILVTSTAGVAVGSERGVMLMNRIGPSSAELYVANSDGTGERKLVAAGSFDYHASYSRDARWIS